MKKFSLIMLSAMLSSAALAAQRLPHPPAAAEKYSLGKEKSPDLVRLKVSLFSATTAVEKNARLDGLVVCSDSACFKPTTDPYVNLPTISDDAKPGVAEFLIPPTTITAIYFTEGVGGNRIEGSLRLDAPLKIEKGFFGGEIMVVLAKQSKGRDTSFVPVQAASGLSDQSATPVYYIPGSTTTKSLPLGATLTIPPDALGQPAIFSVAVRDTGNTFPHVDIYPYLDLKSPAVLETAVIQRDNKNRSSDGIAMTPAPQVPLVDAKGRMFAPPEVGESKARIELKRTGVVNGKSQGKSAHAASSGSNIVTTLGDTSQCMAMLNNPATISYIETFFPNNGVVYINWCANIPPFVTMAYINLNDVRIKYSIPAFKIDAKGTVPLKRLTDFGSGIVMMNGTVWSGDYGITSGGFGKVEGFVNAPPGNAIGSQLGSNIVGGGSYYAGATFDGPKFGMSIASILFAGLKAPYAVAFGMGDGSTQPPAAAGYNQNVVSSSTSVVKNGTCQSPGGENRWSAVGANNGRMLMASSTSDGSTSAAELCLVFKAFAMQNALRLDGGPSASIAIDSVLKNPLTGFDRLKYGDMRHIAYPLRISY
jgi:hypothetical protein